MKPQKRGKPPVKRPAQRSAPAPNRNSKIEFQKSDTVLLAVTGTSPAILTETVWALAQEDPPVIPDLVSVITTTTGLDSIRRELLSPQAEGGPNLWDHLRREVLGPKFQEDSRLQLQEPRLITAPDSRAGRVRILDDIRTLEDNDATANFILDEIRKITFNDDARLVASLAGGRKTMGALLYAAMALLGRHRDRLTHVLVTEPFENQSLRPKFFFPSTSPTAHQLPQPEGPPLVFSSAAARLALAEVPFPRLRYLFSDQLGRFPGRFMDLVRTATDLVGEISRPVEISLRVETRTAIASFDGTPVTLTGRDVPFFEFLFGRVQQGLPPFASHSEAEAPFQAFLQPWTQKHPAMPLDIGGSLDWGKHPPQAEDLRKRLNSLRDRLRGEGLGRLIPLLLPLRGPLGLPPERVTFPAGLTSPSAGR